MSYLLILFHSRNHALAMLNYLRGRGIACSTMNAPRSLTKSCGIALRTNTPQSVLLNSLNGCPNVGDIKIYIASESFGGTNYRQIY